jgi:hypothetical protein
MEKLNSAIMEAMNAAAMQQKIQTNLMLASSMPLPQVPDQTHADVCSHSSYARSQSPAFTIDLLIYVLSLVGSCYRGARSTCTQGCPYCLIFTFSPDPRSDTLQINCQLCDKVYTTRAGA